MKISKRIKGFFFPLLLTLSFFQLSEKRSIAGPFGDEMAKCLVQSTNSKDNISLVRWIVRVYGEHPDSNDFINLSIKDKEKIDKEIAALFNRLLLEDCKKETKMALNYEGDQVLFTAFQIMGQVAGRELNKEKNVAEAINKFLNYIDTEKLEYINN